MKITRLIGAALFPSLLQCDSRSVTLGEGFLHVTSLMSFGRQENKVQ